MALGSMPGMIQGNFLTYLEDVADVLELLRIRAITSGP